MRLAPAGARAVASLLGIALARALVGELRGEPPASVLLQFPYGAKPFSPAGAHFSISHSGAWLAGIACLSTCVGLDIEQIPAVPGAAAGRDLADWTAREATVKAMGASLAEAAHVQVEASQCRWRQQCWALLRPALAAGLVAAVASAEPLRLSVRELSWQALIGPLADEAACA